MIQHHPNDETLGLYAFDALKAGARLVVDTHLRSCGRCRRAVSGFEAAGAVLMEEGEGVPLAPGALRRTLERLGEPQEPPPRAVSFEDLLERGWWLPAAPGLWFKPLRSFAGSGEHLYFLKARGGVALPEHGHSGCERLAVLRGAVEDETGRYGPGDFAECDEALMHQPRAAAGAVCVCLAVTDGPLKFRGVARLMQPLLGV